MSDSDSPITPTLEAPNDFDAAKSRDLEWAVWNRGERSIFLPRRVAIRNCGYQHPGPVKPTETK